MGDLPGNGKVWFHPQGIANILSLAKFKEKYREISTVRMETSLLSIRKMGQKGISSSQKGVYIILQFVIIISKN